MNINKAVDTKYENSNLSAIANAPVEALEGVGPSTAKVLKEVTGIDLVRDMQYFNLKLAKLNDEQIKKLADAFSVKTKEELLALPFVAWAKAVVALAPYERLNINAALDRNLEGKTFDVLVKEDVEGLEGIGAGKAKMLHEAGVKTIGDLGAVDVAKLSDANAALLMKALDAKAKEDLAKNSFIQISASILALATAHGK